MPHVGAKATHDAAKLALTDRAAYLILAQLNAAIAPSDMGLPGLGLQDQVDYEDYH
jgi:hypothetical protein